MSASARSEPPNHLNPFQRIRARHLIGAFILFQLAGGLASSFCGGIAQVIAGISATDPVWISIGICLGWAFYLWWLKPYLYKRMVSPQVLIGSTQLTRYDIRQAILTAVGCLLFSMGAWSLSAGFLDALFPQFSQEFLNTLLMEPSSALPVLQKILTTGLLVIVAPTIEEFLFRGLLLHRWDFKWSLIPSILIGSIVFGVFHINPIGLTVFGVMMALLYLKSCKLVVPALAHAINNGIVAVGLWLPQGNASSLEQTAGYLIAGLTYLCFALPLLGWLAYSLWKTRKATLPYVANSSLK